MTFQMTLDSEQRLARIYPLLKETLTDLRPVFGRISVGLERGVRETFAQEGPGWKELAPFTVRMRLARGFGGSHPILVQTGALRESLLSKTAFGHYERLEKGGMVWGTTIPYAAQHQYGTSKIPQRRILEGSRLIPMVSKILADEIPVEVRRAVRGLG